MATNRMQIAASLGATNSGALDKIFEYDQTVSSFVETKYDFPSFDVNSPDVLYFGNDSVFNTLYMDLSEHASSSTALGITWSYWNGSIWSSITPSSDGSSGLSTSGEVVFTTPGDWALTNLDTAASVTSVDATNRYWMKMTFTPQTSNMKLDIHEARLVDPPAFTSVGLAPWTFTLNPSSMTPHPDREQSVRRTMGGSVNIQAATGDGAVREMTWEGLDESRWEQFIHGITGSEYGKFDRVFFYNEEVGGAESRQIVDQTNQSYTVSDLTIPFMKSSTQGMAITEWMSEGATKDRLLVGMSSKFYGIRFEFKKTGSRYLTSYIGEDSISNIESITIRFVDSTGDLGGTVSSITLSKDSNYSNDGTELFTHDGQIKWSTTDVTNWTAASLNTIIDNTSELSNAPPADRDSTELYYAEITLNYRLVTSDGINSLKAQDIKITDIRSAIDSLHYLATIRSDGTVPYWYLYIPDELKNYRPRNRKEESWIPIKIIDVIRTPVSDKSRVKKRWNITLRYVVATDYEAPVLFRLDDKPLDSQAFLYLKQ